MQSAAPAAPPALHLLTSYFIDSILGRGPAAGRHGEGAQPRGGAAGGGAPGRLRGTGAGEEEAAAVPHHVQHVPAGGAGARLLQVPLPRRVHQRGAGPAAGPDGSPGAGLVPKQKGKVEET
ncbi:hypothetical protein RLOC_00014993 [Lonchura striata]|uniref:Uncharacterized protein n=1 Tax=Lonchura striata TaxID=40157 RepID=A0A218V3I2_9PASE|nr:hypothetical protein RLOC_00014993 [Lonchura striata domestica]